MLRSHLSAPRPGVVGTSDLPGQDHIPLSEKGELISEAQCGSYCDVILPPPGQAAVLLWEVLLALELAHLLLPLFRDCYINNSNTFCLGFLKTRSRVKSIITQVADHIQLSDFSGQVTQTGSVAFLSPLSHFFSPAEIFCQLPLVSPHMASWALT